MCCLLAATPVPPDVTMPLPLPAHPCCSSDLFKRTMHRYMKRCPKPYMSIVRANVDGDWENLVRTRPVGQWRETLALLATYTAQEDWTHLCDVLATRLNGAGMHHAASLCYICAGNVDSAVAYWSKLVGGSAKVMGFSCCDAAACTWGHFHAGLGKTSEVRPEPCLCTCCGACGVPSQVPVDLIQHDILQPFVN